MSAIASNRRYELDWLRVSAIMVVFLYHSTRFFNLGNWHVKNVATYVWVEIWIVFASSWMMPLFFIISGASLFYTIGKSGGWRRFYEDKFLRLMIPVVFASVTHSAMQVYLERLTHGQFSGSFFSFLPQYFNGAYLFIGSTGNFAWHGMHLWYLLFLFVYGLITYPLFAWLKGSGKQFLNRITALFTAPGLMVLGFSAPLFLVKALIPEVVLAAGAGGWGFVYYIWFLIAGFMIVSSDRLQQHIKKQRWLSLCLGVVLSFAYLNQLFGPSPVGFPPGIDGWVRSMLSFFSAWCWLFAILGFGMQRLAFDRPVLRHTNEGVLAFYIMHQTVLLAIGYFVMTWEIHDALKWAIVFTSSFILIITLYLLLVKRLDLLRFLFGMKTTRPFFDIFRKRTALLLLHALYIALIVCAVAGASRNRVPMPLVFDPDQDILLNSAAITDRSSAGVLLVNDGETSNGRAIEFSSGANQQAEAHPEVYIEMRFSAPAGWYTVWVRGKSDIDNEYTDSVWMQVDDQIGTMKGSARLGNWLDIHPPGVYGWASDSHTPISMELKRTGDHTIRIQPRQTPHRIDQVWLSRFQTRIPDTFKPIRP